MPEKSTPEHDPVVNKSLSLHLLISSLILVLTLIWGIYDEVYSLRPWKAIQANFTGLYGSFLAELKPQQAAKQQEVTASSGYQDLKQKYDVALASAQERDREIGNRVSTGVTPRMTAVRSAFQVLQSEIGALTYQIEVSGSDSAKASLQAEIDEIKQREVELEIPLDDGSGNMETVTMTFPQIEAEYARLRDLRTELQTERARLLEPVSAARNAMDGYMADNLDGLTEQAIDGLIRGNEEFESGIKQIHLGDIDWVDRCESCHLGVRQPVEITAAAMGGHAEFVSHPNRDLLTIHDPERFACSLCHNGNGRATSATIKGHGKYRHWLWPMWAPENREAGCHQCHAREIVTDQAEVLNKGRELFLNKGCWGCHRFEGFDKESEMLASVSNQIEVLGGQRAANEKERQRALARGDQAEERAESQRFYARAEALRLRNSTLDAEISALRKEEKSLVNEVRKFGPNLKEVGVKLRKEWIPVWLKNPHEFRPGAKMPAFRLLDNEIQAISAYLWQNATKGTLENRAAGNAERGKELFETRGCMGCHSMGEGDEKQGGTFAANLTRVGEKTNFNFLVRWILDPAVVTGDNGQQAHMIPLMPNLRLSTDEARDIASYLMTRKTDATYAPADFMDDPNLAAEGLTLVRHYGCAGCHEVAGMEAEGRIGTELTFEGSKPVERLDFALFTHEAEHDGWYNHKGFFERKLKNPAFFDEGKVKANHLEQLRMPNFNLSDDEITALTTFLLGSVDSGLPPQYRNVPEDARADIQAGWWLIKRYNCNGCHQIRPGDRTSFQTIPRYEDPAWAEQFPPQLYTEGARVQPDWLIGFLNNPALSETDLNRNGLRRYLQARMPTFHFTERQVGLLMRFFMARSSQPHPYMLDDSDVAPLSGNERTAARALFTSVAAPCLKCHMTGNAAHDQTATAPNFVIARQRLKPDWTYRWLLNPADIAPGTAMPSDLFRRDGDRWVFNGTMPAAVNEYQGDHAELLVRYMFQFTSEELRSLGSGGVQ